MRNDSIGHSMNSRGGSRIFFRRRSTCSTSTPINHIVFFLQNTSCIRKPQVISGRGRRAHPLHPPPRCAPEPLFDMSLSTFEIGADAASLRNSAEITVIMCEQKPIRYDFRDDAETIPYSMNIQPQCITRNYFQRSLLTVSCPSLESHLESIGYKIEREVKLAT